MPWEMSEVLVELLRQSHYLLKPGGRLVRDLLLRRQSKLSNKLSLGVLASNGSQ